MFSPESGILSIAVFLGLSSINARLLVPGCGLCGFPWVVPLVGLVHVPWCGFFSLGSLGCLCLAVGGGYGLVLLCPSCGFSFIWLVCLLACMWDLVCIVSPLPGVWAWLYFVGFPLGICLCLLRANAPLLILREVLSGFHFLWWPWPLVFFLVVCGALPFWK